MLNLLVLNVYTSHAIFQVLLIRLYIIEVGQIRLISFLIESYDDISFLWDCQMLLWNFLTRNRLRLILPKLSRTKNKRGLRASHAGLHFRHFGRRSLMNRRWRLWLILIKDAPMIHLLFDCVSDMCISLFDSIVNGSCHIFLNIFNHPQYIFNFILKFINFRFLYFRKVFAIFEWHFLLHFHSQFKILYFIRFDGQRLIKFWDHLFHLMVIICVLYHLILELLHG